MPQCNSCGILRMKGFLNMRRFILVLFSLLLVLCLSVSVAAQSTEVALSGDKVVITDENWAYEKVHVYGWEIDEYLGDSSEVSIPWSFAKEYVTTIGDYAFNENTTITSVTTTSKIESISDYAFNRCTSLETVVLCDSLTSLGVGCFYGTVALDDVDLINTSITSVPAYCFAESGVFEVNLPETCTSIGNMAFYHCSSLEKILIPDSVTEIADNAFLECPNVTIYGNEDSYAIAYAQENNIPYFINGTTTYLVGDADHDGTISVLDATVIQKYLASLISDEDGWIRMAGSTDGMVLNITHATAIQKYLACIEISDPVGTEVTRIIH